MINSHNLEDMISLRQNGSSLKKIGEKYGISGERARQLVGYIKRKAKYPPGIKRCYQCKKTLSTDHFYKSKNESNNNRCIDCLKHNSNIWTKKYLYKYKVNGEYGNQIRARACVQYKVHTGSLIKPKICSINDNCKGRIEAHHYLGYEPEHWLDIQWLCTKHHAAVDSN